VQIDPPKSVGFNAAPLVSDGMTERNMDVSSFRLARLLMEAALLCGLRWHRSAAAAAFSQEAPPANEVGKWLLEAIDDDFRVLLQAWSCTVEKGATRVHAVLSTWQWSAAMDESSAGRNRWETAFCQELRTSLQMEGTAWRAEQAAEQRLALKQAAFQTAKDSLGAIKALQLPFRLSMTGPSVAAFVEENLEKLEMLHVHARNAVALVGLLKQSLERRITHAEAVEYSVADLEKLLQPAEWAKCKSMLSSWICLWNLFSATEYRLGCRNIQIPNITQDLKFSLLFLLPHAIHSKEPHLFLKYVIDQQRVILRNFSDYCEAHKISGHGVSLSDEVLEECVPFEWGRIVGCPDIADTLRVARAHLSSAPDSVSLFLAQELFAGRRALSLALKDFEFRDTPEFVSKERLMEAVEQTPSSPAELAVLAAWCDVASEGRVRSALKFVATCSSVAMIVRPRPNSELLRFSSSVAHIPSFCVKFESCIRDARLSSLMSLFVFLQARVDPSLLRDGIDERFCEPLPPQALKGLEGVRDRARARTELQELLLCEMRRGHVSARPDNPLHFLWLQSNLGLLYKHARSLYFALGEAPPVGRQIAVEPRRQRQAVMVWLEGKPVKEFSMLDDISHVAVVAREMLGPNAPALFQFSLEDEPGSCILASGATLGSIVSQYKLQNVVERGLRLFFLSDGPDSEKEKELAEALVIEPPVQKAHEVMAQTNQEYEVSLEEDKRKAVVRAERDAAVARAEAERQEQQRQRNEILRMRKLERDDLSNPNGRIVIRVHFPDGVEMTFRFDHTNVLSDLLRIIQLQDCMFDMMLPWELRRPGEAPVICVGHTSRGWLGGMADDLRLSDAGLDRSKLTVHTLEANE
jgi:hypothetical protein